MAEVVWTRAQQKNTLRAVGIVRASVGNVSVDQNITDAVTAVTHNVPGALGEADFQSVAPDLVTGLVNLAATLAEHFAQYKGNGTTAQDVLDDVNESIRGVTLRD